MKQQFLENIADTFKTYVYENNRKIVPSAAVLTIYKPSDSAIFINAATMTIGSDGLLSYSLTATNNLTCGENYKAIIKYTYNSTDYYFNLFYDVVKSKLVKVITDEDIVNELPQLKDNGWKIRGTASSGSTTTIVDVNLKRYEDDYFTGGTAYSIAKDETHEITDFVSSTGTITTTTFSATISAGEKYVLTRSYTKEIQRAFEKIEDRLNRKGKRPYLVLDPYDLREVHIYFTVAEICKGFMKDGNGTFWWELWKDYEQKADNAFLNVPIKYDITGDGVIAGDEVNKRIGPIKVRF